MERVFIALQENGLLLVQDRQASNVVGLITGESLKGSWWAHPRAHEIFETLGMLAEHPDVLFAKLVSGKETLIHRRLWPHVLVVAMRREKWQLMGLSAEASRMLAGLDDTGRPIHASGPAARELALRLLVTTQQEHTESGRHQLVLEPWLAWANRADCSPAADFENSKKRIEQAVIEIGAPIDALPWKTHKRIRRR